jgi:hypothetical protein
MVKNGALGTIIHSRYIFVQITVIDRSSYKMYELTFGNHFIGIV